MKIRIEPYKMWSGGAKALGLRAGILRATRRQVSKHGDFDYIINWGNTERRFEGEYINNPEAVATACNKLETARILGNFGVPQPDYTTDIEVSRVWWEEDQIVVCRTLLRANSGRGITLASKEREVCVVRAPLYTKYIPKTTEYRIHVLGDQVIDAQEKRKRQEVPNEEVDYQVRNAAAGWVFCRDNVTVPACVSDAAIRSVSALDLDFGAVDVGFNARRDKCRVYEVNTAPGLEGTTLDNYYEAFEGILPALRGGRYALRRRAS